MIHAILLDEMPKITKLLLSKQLKSIKRYTTHNI
jgi:hypothetical protein